MLEELVTRSAYAIADNKLAEAGEWSEELLRLELGDLRRRDVDGDPYEAPEPPADVPRRQSPLPVVP